MPKQTLILDSSQLSVAYECLEKWYLLNVRGLTVSNEVTAKMAAGTLFHKWLEIYYRARGCGASIADAKALVDAYDYDKADEIDSHHFPADSDLRNKLHAKKDQYFLTYALKDYEVSCENRYAVKIVDGLPVDTTEPFPLIERGFSYKLFESNEYLFILEGKIDFIGSMDGVSLWMDHKVQLSRSDLFEKSIQFRNYALVTNLPFGIINYIRLADKLDKDSFVRKPINFSAHERLYWKEELIEKYVQIAKTIKRDVWGTANTLNRDSCPGRFHTKCMFVPYCNEFGPSMKQAIAERDFIKKIEWKPW